MTNIAFIRGVRLVICLYKSRRPCISTFDAQFDFVAEFADQSKDE